jgi:hypothetical protein
MSAMSSPRTKCLSWRVADELAGVCAVDGDRVVVGGLVL